MYHVEMRMGINVVRAFNQTPHDLQVRFLAPLAAGQEFRYEGHDWVPRKVRMTILEGPELAVYELGMGLGWGTAEKKSDDVTEEILAQAKQGGIASATGGPVGDDALMQRVIGRLSGGPLSLGDTVRIAGDLMEGRRVSEQLAASEMAVWALLHSGRAQLEADGGAVAKEMWEAVVLSPHSWLDGDRGVRLLPGS